MWNNNVSLSQLRESSRVMCFAAKWRGKRDVEFRSEFHDSHRDMVLFAHELLSEADAVITYNGDKHDLPHLRKEFLLAELPPPAPFQSIDLLKAVKKTARFPSNKLDYVAQALGVGGKLSHTGHELWVQCMAGDEKAWDLMRRYNIQDVRITEKVYDRLLPWIPSHPHVALYDDIEGDSCQNCGSTDLRKEGFAYTPLGKFQQYQCKKCGRWSRGKRAIASVELRGVAK